MPDIPKLPERNRHPDSSQLNPNQSNPNQINLNQVNPNQVNRNQLNPSQMNPKQNSSNLFSTTNKGREFDSNQERQNAVPKTFGFANKKNIQTNVLPNETLQKNRLSDFDQGESIAKPIYNFSTSNQNLNSNKVDKNVKPEVFKPEVFKPVAEKLTITVNLVQPKSNPSSISSNPGLTGNGRTV